MTWDQWDTLWTVVGLLLTFDAVRDLWRTRRTR